ncbi:hypothetical protein BU26DRAFT_523636 [Trematosphaeria pertusa]|uniref:HIG1 domain-containing protein n=1 Tax=Trematosphaeria pertusa TaxID=390896 RepID=A0A6A6HYK2_9PLEO|nr:uncharacterized protein BU26DRAFT_523636 [Trematosphaeria pertusa]KAF2243295.1 hypothetical protein BU26DRAFT_523636 [Trematosphaeria pertusa]
MKILTKEEEQAHYNATFNGTVYGGVVGSIIGVAGVWAASARFPAFRSLTVPFRAFLASAPGTFGAVIAADRASARYDLMHNPEKLREAERAKERATLYEQHKSPMQRAKDWAEENRYPIIFGFWVLSLGGSFLLVKRQPLSASQKLVQARMYAQGLTLGVLLASFAFEANDATKGKGRWETIKVIDPNDPEHKHLIEKRIHHERYAGEDQWREMVEAEERRIQARKEAAAAKQHEGEAQKKESKAAEPAQ